MPNPQSACLGALALELRPDAHATHAALEPAAAAELAEGMARDLAILVPDAAMLDLVVLAAHYDPVELLRPGWSLHAALDALALRAPPGLDRAADDGRILAFGTHEGALPEAVAAPDPDYAQGSLRLVPFLLRGDASMQARVERVGHALEEVLIDRGMAGAATALFAQHAFGAPIEHARYLTIHDLAALMAMQYEHAGLAELWPLIEAALLAPPAETWLDAPPEPLALYADGGVRIALLDSEAWRNGGFAPASAGEDADKLELAYEHFEARQRQIAAVLDAHGVPLTFDHCPAGKDPREVLKS
ncbi:MAG TPA: hypothetical protein VK660_10280 [Xanthomonadaceae bacterium]|jgi:hypothetical protein|nr:hypothetical protein [Xanthomonadaceae bacterium]